MAVQKSLVKVSTLQSIKTIDFGSSASSTLIGSPIIVIGSPLGITGSVDYGIVTSSSGIKLPDSAYKALTTDIYGSSNATGALINMKGQLIGVIDNQYNSDDAKNILTAVGITELKRIIELLSNDSELLYIGIYATDVTLEANEELGVPYGAYVTQIDMDSPAMSAGIQSGDVITGIEDNEITTYKDLITFLNQSTADTIVEVTLMRQSPDGYTEMKVEMTIITQK